ncbi:MAG: LamG-like jellyroll fold domain-containing protein, partial [Bacteroidota bacterium]
DVFDFIIEEGVEREFEATHGFSMTGDLWESVILKIAEVLQVISNNGPDRIGGGGTPLQPLACSLGEVGSGSTCQALPLPEPIAVVLLDQCPDSTFLVGDEVLLSATVAHCEFPHPPLVWMTLDTTVAQVDSLGGVRMLGAGSTAVVVSMLDGSAADTCLLSVDDPPQSSPEPLFHWPFDGDPLDLTSNAHTVVLNGASFTGNRRQGSHALLLDGLDDWVDISHPALQEPFDERTFMAWVNFDDRRPSSVIYEEGGAYNGLGVKVQDSRLFVRAKVGGETVDLDIPYTYRHYQHIAVTFEQGVVRLFHNGLLVGLDSLPVQSMPDHSDPAALGATQSRDVWQGEAGQFMKGKIDDVRIYQRALSGPEVAQRMRGTTTVVFGTEKLPVIKTSTVPYPNPSLGIFSLSMTESIDPESQFIIYDLTGAEVSRQKRPMSSGTHQIDLTTFESGIYILQVSGKRFTLIKQ